MYEKKRVKYHGLDRVQVDYGIGADRKRARKFYEDEAAADKAIDEYKKSLKASGEWWTRKPVKV